MYVCSEMEAPNKLYIFDARGSIAATLNKAAGKGTEDVATYQHTELVFCNVGNIHAMRASYASLSELLMPGGHNTALQYGEINIASAGFYSRLEESGWLKHIKLLLQASVRVAEKMHLEAASVLIHCSDGWDRTAQICSLAEILLDPHYRTFQGLASLIEKDWCSFGYKFHDRCGFGRDGSVSKDELSPVFVQFLDVLYQLLVQFPRSFEYSEQLLVFLADHLHSCLFGTFLGNSDLERHQVLQVAENTRSIWSYVWQFKATFENTSYVPCNRPLWPSTNMSKIELWKRFHCRWDPECHPHPLADSAWHDDWSDYTMQ